MLTIFPKDRLKCPVSKTNVELKSERLGRSPPTLDSAVYLMTRFTTRTQSF